MDTTNILSFHPASFPVPIFKYNTWINVTFPDNIEKKALMKILEKQLDTIKQFTRTKSIRQIKINTDIS